MKNNRTGTLADWFSADKEYTLLFSAGFDSCSLLSAAKQANAVIHPVWIDNGLNRTEVKHIQQQAKNMGYDSIKTIKMYLPQSVQCNPTDRCYHCKQQILLLATTNNRVIIDGTVADDLSMYRPGAKALKEFNVLSPLADLGITKNEARQIALDGGASTHIAELESCMATRINYKLEITPERIDTMRQIELLVIEETRDYDVRCRMDDEEHIRIEVKKQESYQLFVSEHFRKRILEISQNLTMFATLDLMSSRPNAYDKKIR